jgi:predicted RNA-binding Zn ribbon-like protein
METPEHIARQRFLGGHLALDFVNTADAEGGTGSSDCLFSYRDLVAWAHRGGIIGEDAADRLLDEAESRPAEASAIHGRAVFLRGEIDRVLRAIASGATPPRDAILHLRDAQAEALTHADLTEEDGRFIWNWPETRDLGTVLWPIVNAASELVTSPALDRVKVCDGCSWLFFDASKNHSRRWCSMKDGCGSEAKVKNYVARRAARRSARN